LVAGAGFEPVGVPPTSLKQKGQALLPSFHARHQNVPQAHFAAGTTSGYERGSDKNPKLKDSPLTHAQTNQYN
jgi:hypothetical protein